MQILFHTTEKQEALNVKMVFELKGIPVFIGSENAGPAIGFIGANKYTVWVCLDDQYQDAVALLENPDHEVTSGIDVEDYYKHIESESVKSANKNDERLMLALVLIVISGFIFWAYSRVV
jgi:Putative prokaryotic signal transducing protein